VNPSPGNSGDLQMHPLQWVLAEQETKRMSRAKLLLRSVALSVLLTGVCGPAGMRALGDEDDSGFAVPALDRLFGQNGKPVIEPIREDRTSVIRQISVGPMDGLLQRFFKGKRKPQGRPSATKPSPIPPVPPDYRPPRGPRAERIAAPGSRPNSAPQAVPKQIIQPRPVPPADSTMQIAPSRSPDEVFTADETGEAENTVEPKSQQPGTAPSFLKSEANEDQPERDPLDLDVIAERMKDQAEAGRQPERETETAADLEATENVSEELPRIPEPGLSRPPGQTPPAVRMSSQPDLLEGREPANTLPPTSMPSVIRGTSAHFNAQRDQIQREQQRRRRQLDQLLERDDQNGFKGFCPVALRDQRKLVDSNTEFSFEFDGNKYSFSSEQARQQFQNDPLRYAPVFGGHDVVAMSEGRQVEGRLEFAVWFRDRLYLFSTRSTMARFHSQPREFAVNRSQ